MALVHNPLDEHPKDGLPEWRGFDEQVIPDAYYHFKANYYVQSLKFFCTEPRSFTGLVNTWMWRAFGFEKRKWIWISISLHVLNALFLWLLMMQLFEPFNAVIVSLIFVLHPIQVPAILQTAARAGVQSATMAYSALLLICLGFQTPEWSALRWWSLLMAVTAQCLAQKSKEDSWIYVVFWPMVIYYAKST